MKRIFSKIVATRRLTQLIILLSFIFTFSIVRLVTHLQKAGILPTQTGNLHIHHMVPGIILLIVSGYIGMSFWNKAKVRWGMAVLFGAGAALTIDEFALWLFLDDVYWEKQGRFSVDAVIIAVGLLLTSFLISEAYGHRVTRGIKRYLFFFRKSPPRI